MSLFFKIKIGESNFTYPHQILYNHKRKMAILEELKNSVSTTLEKEKNNNKEVITSDKEFFINEYGEIIRNKKSR